MFHRKFLFSNFFIVFLLTTALHRINCAKNIPNARPSYVMERHFDNVSNLILVANFPLPFPAMASSANPGEQPAENWWSSLGRGGYTTGLLPSLEDLKNASSTFENYISGTILIVFCVFFTFLFISAMTLILMGYAR